MLPVLDRFAPIFREHKMEIQAPPVNERLDEVDLLSIIADIDGVICGDDHFTARVLEAAPKLKVLSKWGTGIDSIDQRACRRLGIAVRNTPNAFSEPVADSVLGYMLCFARKLPWMHNDMRRGIWYKVPGVALRECTLGVIGVGNVGKAVVFRALAFGIHVVGNDIVEMPDDFLNQTGIEMVSKEVLIAQSDFISLNCDLNPTSYHLIGSIELDEMKRSAVLINTSRGSVVDELALEEALLHGQIAGAALDVFEREPLPETSRLRDLDNVLLAPHNSNSSPEAWQRVHINTINNLIEELSKSNE